MVAELEGPVSSSPDAAATHPAVPQPCFSASHPRTETAHTPLQASRKTLMGTRAEPPSSRSDVTHHSITYTKPGSEWTFKTLC